MKRETLPDLAVGAISSFGWWVVVDRDEPEYGAHCVLATDAAEAKEKGGARWYDELGEQLEHLVALRIPLTVSWKQLHSEGSIVKGFARDEIEEVAEQYGKKVLGLKLESGEERWLLVNELPCTVAEALARLGKHPTGDAYRAGELYVTVNGQPATFETQVTVSDHLELHIR